DVRQAEAPLLLDVDGVRPVHEDVGDVGILQQGIERAEAEYLEADLVDEALALEAREQRRIRRQEALESRADVLLGLRGVERCDRDQIEALEELAVHAQLQLAERLARGARARRGGVDAHGSHALRSAV